MVISIMLAGMESLSERKLILCALGHASVAPGGDGWRLN